MVCGYSTASKVIKNEKDLSSERCRGCRSEEIMDLPLFVVEGSCCRRVRTAEEVFECFWRITARACTVVTVPSSPHVCLRGEDVGTVFDGPCVEPSWGAIAVSFIKRP